MCDECETVFHGPFQGEFTKEARHLSYEELSTGWKHGTVDASWFCVDCWADKLDIASIGRTRKGLGLPEASWPAAVIDNRFHQHTDRWSICGNCDCYCTARARDWLPGSFVYCTDNSPAGPPKSRNQCFPKLFDRGAPWRNDSWDAKFLCRTCLVQQWQKMPEEINAWLTLHNKDGRRHRSRGDSGSGPAAEAADGMAVQLERIPTRQLVGRQPERLAMTPWLISLNMYGALTQDVALTQNGALTQT